jgi:hypothetical protein
MVSFPYAKEVEIYCKKLVEKLRPRSIILYGSMARGDYGVGSDVDILVISDDLPPNFLERLRLLSEANPTLAPIQAVGYTPAEFLQMIHRRHPTALYAVADGKPLHDDGFFQGTKQVFEKVKKDFDLVRTEHGWDARTLSARILR